MKISKLQAKFIDYNMQKLLNALDLVPSSHIWCYIAGYLVCLFTALTYIYSQVNSPEMVLTWFGSEYILVPIEDMWDATSPELYEDTYNEL